jgi:hypothetical protein
MAILDDLGAPFGEKDISIWGNVKKWGLISALVGVCFQLIQQVTNVMGKGMAVIILYSLVTIAIGITLYYLGLKEHRDTELGGYMSFKRAFYLAFMIGMVSGVIALIFNYVYMNFINPGAVEAQLEMTREMMEKFGLPEDKLDEAIEQQRKSLSSPFTIVSGLFVYAIASAICALIMGAIMKKERPMF